MTISLLHIVVPTVLVLVVLILHINSRSKRMLNEIAELKTQLAKLENVSVVPEQVQVVKEEPQEEPAQEEPIQEPETEIENQDAEAEITIEPEASKYNTGKSGKIYTKEELELLIKE